jgi:hypothetical protein
MTTQNTSQTAAGSPPDLRTARDAAVSLALWGQYENGPHASGRLMFEDKASRQRVALNVSGFFRLTEKGEVQLPLSTRANNAYENVGTIYFKDGVGRFYARDKTNIGTITVYATPNMPEAVQQAIGVNPALAPAWQPASATQVPHSTPTTSTQVQRPPEPAQSTAPSTSVAATPLAQPDVQTRPGEVQRPRFNA